MSILDPNVRRLWSRTRVLVWPDEYVLVSLPNDTEVERLAALVAASRGAFFSLLVERDEVSVTISADEWARVADAYTPLAVAGPYRALTLDLSIDLGVSGYLLPAAELLARGGIPIIPQCGYLKDHLLIRSADVERTVELLTELSRRSAAEDGDA